jgi:hypothetical protein
VKPEWWFALGTAEVDVGLIGEYNNGLARRASLVARLLFDKKV